MGHEVNPADLPPIIIVRHKCGAVVGHLVLVDGVEMLRRTGKPTDLRGETWMVGDLAGLHDYGNGVLGGWSLDLPTINMRPLPAEVRCVCRAELTVTVDAVRHRRANKKETLNLA